MSATEYMTESESECESERVRLCVCERESDRVGLSVGVAIVVFSPAPVPEKSSVAAAVSKAPIGPRPRQLASHAPSPDAQRAPSDNERVGQSDQTENHRDRVRIRE